MGGRPSQAHGWYGEDGFPATASRPGSWRNQCGGSSGFARAMAAYLGSAAGDEQRAIASLKLARICWDEGCWRVSVQGSSR